MRDSGVHIFESTKENINYSTNTITLILYGNPLTNDVRDYWGSKLVEYGLEKTNFVVEQSGSTDLQNKVEELTDLYAHNQEIITSRDKKIEQSEDKIKFLQEELKKYNSVPFVLISREARINYNGLKTLSYANYITTDFKTIDTLAVFNTSWYDSIPDTHLQEQKLKEWLKIRLQLDTLKIISE